MENEKEKQEARTDNLPALRDKWVGDTFSLTPRTIEEALKFADMIAKSSMVPPQFQGKPGDVLVAVQMGMEVGLKPLQALQNIAVINGRPCLWGDAVRALIQNSGKQEYCQESDDGQTATCTMKRRDNPKESKHTFSAKDADSAGLSGKDTWKKYPARMRQWRAYSWCARDLFSDVLKGLSIAEEAQDFELPRDVTPRTEIEPPRIKSEVQKQAEKPKEEAKPATEVGNEGRYYVDLVTVDKKSGVYEITINKLIYLSKSEAVARLASKCKREKTAVVPSYETQDGKRWLVELQVEEQKQGSLV